MAFLFDHHNVTTSTTSSFRNYNTDVYELDENSPRTPFTFGNIILKSHQETLLHHCLKLENERITLSECDQIRTMCRPNDSLLTKVGVLADRVGSGKSFVIIALMMKSEMRVHQDDILIKSFGYNNVTFSVNRGSQHIKTNLLVIPHNLTSQWSEYLNMFPSISYFVMNKKSFTAIQTDEMKLEDYDLVIITPTYYNKFAVHMQDTNVAFQRVIYDEVDNLKIPSCRSFNARFIWLVTASYGNIIYPRGFTRWEPSMRRYIWCAQGIEQSGYLKNMLVDIFHQIPRQLHALLVIKNKDEYVQRSLDIPPVVRTIVPCKTPRTIRILDGLVERNIIECLNANNIQGAIAHVNPSNKASEDNIIEIMLQKYDTQLTNLRLRLTHTEQYLYENEGERAAEIQRLQSKIDDLTNKMNLIKQRIMDSNTCIICYDDIENKTIINCCHNTFCFKCINIWFSHTALCPLCKLSKSVKDLYIVSENEKNSIDTQMIVNVDVDPNVMGPHWDKYTNLRILLRNRDRESKFLIFSNHDNSFVQIYDILHELDINFEHVKGNSFVVKNIVNRYKNGSVNVLLVNSSHYGSGLNLENTTDIVMFHKFDTEIDKQVVGRADRLGRTSPLRIWYLVYENENNTQNT